MLCPQLIRCLSLDESIIFCETLLIDLVLADGQGVYAELKRPVSQRRTPRETLNG